MRQQDAFLSSTFLIVHTYLLVIRCWIQGFEPFLRTHQQASEIWKVNGGWDADADGMYMSSVH
jgi:hypothetical protein